MSAITPAPLPLLGAYAMAPADADEAAAFYRALAHESIGGLEIPAPATELDSDAVATIARRLQPGWHVMLTAIPVVMGRLGANPAYGLASSDEASRAEALADIARSVELARRLADLTGEHPVTVIEAHSAPGPVLGNADAFTRSLETIASWDLAGAQVAIEHCDALVEGQTAAKGFLTLEDEIAAIRAAGSPAAIGIGINWGRSAIEGRDANTPVAHLGAAAEAGLLRAVVFSGATDQATPWGDPWADAHIPSRGTDPALAASDGSLLDDEAIAAALAAAGMGPGTSTGTGTGTGTGDTAPVLAVKVSVRPRDVSVDSRIAVARAVLTQLEALRVA